MSSEYEKLIEAARAVVNRWDTPHWKNVPATAEYINDLRNALPPASPAPAKGVRCWRNNKGDFAGTIDRQRWTGERMEDVHRDGTVTPAGRLYTVALAENLVARGEWVECPDAPYVASPVAAPEPAMPPEGTRWKSGNQGSFYEVRNGELQFWAESSGKWMGGGISIEHVDRVCGPRIPPTTTPPTPTSPRETAEQVVER